MRFTRGRVDGSHWRRVLVFALLAMAPAAAAFAAGRILPARPPSAPYVGDIAFPENSPWTTLPTSDDLRACMPGVSAVPAGKAVATCRVGRGGALEACDLNEIRDARMKQWAACILPRFQAKIVYSGQMVKVPLQFTDEPDR